MLHEQVDSILQRLRAGEDGVWWTRFAFADREDVELYVSDPSCPQRMAHTRQCLHSLPSLLPEMEAALTAAPAENPLFPPVPQRRWDFVGLEFTHSQPERGTGIFHAEEKGYKFIYVQYFVELENGRPVGIRTEFW